LTRVSGSVRQGRDPCPLLLQRQHQESPLGHVQSVTLTVAPTFVPGARRALRPWHDTSSRLRDGCLSHSLRSLVISAPVSHAPHL
jgi:hypothetical protein